MYVMCKFVCVPRGVRLILGVCRARAHTFVRSLSQINWLPDLGEASV
jgi:hypothetical protein